MTNLAEQEARRGQPVLFLGLLVAGWILLRIVMWESPWPAVAQSLAGQPLAELETATPREIGPTETSASPAVALRAERHGSDYPDTGYVDLNPPAPPAHLMFAPGEGANAPIDGERKALGHSLLWMAGMGELPMPRDVADWLDREQPLRVAPSVPPKTRPWRIDAWLLLRQGGPGRVAGSGSQPASYGASQAGAVVSYRLAPDTRHEPSAYVRASKALVADGEAELALGLKARPLAGIPLAVHAEMRTARTPAGAKLRPAAFVTTGIDRARLPLNLRAEGYAQAGYVGGDFATGFADGRLTVTREVARRDRFSLDGGAGTWGGIQRDASRLDIGPTLKLEMNLGDAPVRLAADYRFRVAGNAEPASGAAITLSTGF